MTTSQKNSATPSMSREQEFEETEKFVEIYNEAVAHCKKNIKPLIVLSHYPVSNWLEGKKTSTICHYFSGHDHRTLETEHTSTVNIYADNQIGYKKKDISFKNCFLGTHYNPFFEHQDGHYEIEPDEYLAFMRYSNERIVGTGLIDQQLKTRNAKLYMIKHEGFYGFFVINQKTGTKICAGGRIKTISKNKNINYFYDCFTAVLSYYATTLAPYRIVQEQISQEVKKLGFDGKIHGCIVDVDFYNHIMLNPQDGTVSFYYSPYFGQVQEYLSFESMLQKIEKKQLKIGCDTLTLYRQMKLENCLITKDVLNISEHIGRMVHIDIKNSIYAVSSRINQIQRIFSSNILREWDDRIAQHLLRSADNHSFTEADKSIKSDKEMDYELVTRFDELINIEVIENNFISWEIKKQITQIMLYAIIRSFIKKYNNIIEGYNTISFSYLAKSKNENEYVDVMCMTTEIEEIYKQLLIVQSQYSKPIRVQLEILKKGLNIRIQLYGSKPKAMLVYYGNYKYHSGSFDKETP